MRSRTAVLACCAVLLGTAGLMAAEKTAGGKAAKVRPQPKAVDEKKLDCGNPQAIRDFKDVAIGKLLGTDTRGKETASEWARAICGQRADAAGFNNPPPPNPVGVPSSPACSASVTREQCAKESAETYFKVYLPISGEQALTLGRHVWEVKVETDKNTGKKTGN